MPSSAASSRLGPLAGLDAGARRAVGAALLAVFVGALDLTVIAAILPRMVADLQVNTADIDRYVWIVSGYLLSYIVAIPLIGRVSDLVGRSRAFAAALAVFLAGSLWCAVADSLGAMIVARAVQGVGGGALLPVSMAFVGDLLPPRRRAAALGLVGAVDTLGWVLGPLWGATVVALAPGDAPWRWVFLVNLPLAALAAVALRRTSPGLPAVAAPRRPLVRHLDVVGAALLAGVLVLLNLGLSAGGEIGGPGRAGGRALGGTHNPLADYSGPLVAGALALAAIFVWWERRAADPLLSPALFRRPGFAPAIAANFVVGAALIVAMVDVPVVVALLVGPTQVSTVTALMMAPFTLLMAALSLGGGALVVARGPRAVAAWGLLLVAVGYGLLWWGLLGGAYPGLLPGLMVAGAGFGLVVAPIAATAIDAAPDAERGIAAALVLVFRLLGMTVSISALTAFGVNRLQGLVGDLEAVVQQPGESTAAFFARQSEILYELVIPVSLRVVRETFLIAGVIALLALVPVWFLSRHIAAGATAPAPAPEQPSEN